MRRGTGDYGGGARAQGAIAQGHLPQVEEVIEGKKSFVAAGEALVPVALGGAGAALAVFPVVSLGDVMGACSF